jgi:hypothetical protein
VIGPRVPQLAPRRRRPHDRIKKRGCHGAGRRASQIESDDPFFGEESGSKGSRTGAG